MGPQPWELRKPHYAHAYASRCTCFNGAAALGAAETGPGQFHQQGREGFNGAAALGAAETCHSGQRNCGHLGFNGAAALGAAETQSRKLDSVKSLKLQWGRSLGSCGNPRNLGV